MHQYIFFVIVFPSYLLFRTLFTNPTTLPFLPLRLFIFLIGLHTPTPVFFLLVFPLTYFSNLPSLLQQPFPFFLLALLFFSHRPTDTNSWVFFLFVFPSYLPFRTLFIIATTLSLLPHRLYLFPIGLYTPIPKSFHVNIFPSY